MREGRVQFIPDGYYEFPAGVQAQLDRIESKLNALWARATHTCIDCSAKLSNPEHIRCRECADRSLLAALMEEQ